MKPRRQINIDFRLAGEAKREAIASIVKRRLRRAILLAVEMNVLFVNLLPRPVQ